MDSSLLFNQETLTVASEASSLESLLEHGIHCIRRGLDVGGVTFFALARERLSPDQMHFAAVLDAFIQSHTSYLQSQQELHLASKRFVEADAAQQMHLVSLEKLLQVLREDTDMASQPYIIAKPLQNSQEHQSPQAPQMVATNSLHKQSSLSLQPLSQRDQTLPALDVTCFGRFEVRRLGQAIVLCHNRSGQAILRYLIAQSGYCASIDRLMGVLWPEGSPEVARRKLQIAASALRCSLNSGYSSDPGGGYILCKDRFYRLNSAVTIRTDVDEFLSLWQAGQQTSGSEAANAYEKACRLYTDSFLVEDIYADWSFIRREQLSQIYLSMCRALTNYYLETGRYKDAAQWANVILKENRYDEEAHRQLIRIYTAQGYRGEALQQYQRCERLLAEDFGVPPMPETVNLLRTMVFRENFPAKATKIEPE